MCCEEYMGHHGHGCGSEHQVYGHHGGHEEGHSQRRRFLTKEERLAELEAYLEGLKAEAQGVEEYIAGLKGK